MAIKTISTQDTFSKLVEKTNETIEYVGDSAELTARAGIIATTLSSAIVELDSDLHGPNGGSAALDLTTEAKSIVDAINEIEEVFDASARDITVSGNLTVNTGGNIVVVQGDVNPSVDGTYDLGASGAEWQNLWLDGTANVDTLQVDQSATINVNLTVNGNTTLGDNASDIVTVNADIASNLIPNQDGQHNLGVSGSEWQNLWIDGTANIDTLQVDESATITQNLTVNGSVTLGDTENDTVTVNADVASDLIPSTDGLYNLGASDAEWQDLWIDGTANVDFLQVDQNATVTGSLTVNGASTTINSTTITLGNANTDNVVFGADVNSNIIPQTDATFSLGTAAQQWDVLHADSAQLNKAVIDNVTIDGTSITSSTALSLIASTGDIELNANDADVILKDNTVTYGSLTNNSGNLQIKSGTTTAVSFSGANTTLSGSLTVPTTLTVNGVTTLGNGAGDTVTTNGDTFTVNNTSFTVNSGTITLGDANTDNVVFGADVNSSIIPNTNNSWNLGSSDFRWNNVYGNVGNYNSVVVDTITIDDSTISGSGSILVDAVNDIVLDAAGNDVLLRANGTQYGALTNTAGNLIVKSGTSTALTFDAANVTAAGSITVTTDLTVNGNTTLGSGDDTVTIGSTISSSLIPTTDNSVDLGSSTVEWRNLYLDGTAKVDALTVDENATISGNLTVNGNTTLGNASGDTITLTGATTTGNTITLTGSVAPTTTAKTVHGALNELHSDVGDIVFDRGGPVDISNQNNLTNAVNAIDSALGDYVGPVSFDSWIVSKNSYLDAINSIASQAQILELSIDSDGSALQALKDQTIGSLASINNPLVKTSVVDAINDLNDINSNLGHVDNDILRYNGTTGRMVPTANNFKVDTSGNTTIAGTLSAAGTTVTTLTASGNATFNGGTTSINSTTINIGNATSDNVAVNAQITTSLIPDANNTHDLGSDALEWRDIWIDGTANLDTVSAGSTTTGSLTVTNNTILGNDGGTDTIDPVGRFINSIVPSANATYSLGASTLRWNAFLQDVTTYGTTTLGDATADTVTINGYIGSNIIPSVNARDLGNTSLRWDGYFQNIVSYGTTTLGDAAGDTITLNGTTTAVNSFIAQESGSTKFDTESYGVRVWGTRDNTTLQLYNTTNDATWLDGSEFGRIEVYSADVSGDGAGLRGALLFESTSTTGAASSFSIDLEAGDTNNILTRVFTIEPNGNATVLGSVTASSFSGNASSASKWQNARTHTVALTGDVTGTATQSSVDGTGNLSVTIATTIAANSVALGTDTTGAYVADIVQGGAIALSETNNNGEGNVVTVAHGNTSDLDGTYPASGNAVSQIIVDSYGHATLIAGATFDNYGGWTLNTDNTSRGTISSGEVVQFDGGTGVDISYTDTNNKMTFAVDLSELTDMTVDVVGSEDELILLDNGVNKRKLISEIKLGQFSNDQGWTSNVGDITGVTAGVGLSGGGTSGTVSLAFDGSELTDMTDAVVGSEDELILLDNGADRRKLISEINLGQFNNDQGWTSNIGDITSVTAGVGLSGGGTSGDVTLAFDGSELTDMTVDVVGSQDELILLDNGADRRKLISEIKLGQFNNDQGWTSNVGDITGVTAGEGLSGGGTSGSVTIDLDILVEDDTDNTQRNMVYKIGNQLYSTPNFRYNPNQNIIFSNTQHNFTATAKFQGAVEINNGLADGGQIDFLSNGFDTFSQDNYQGIMRWYNTSGMRFQIDASGNATAAGNVTAYSDQRLKSNIRTIPNALEKVSEMRGVHFTKDDHEGSGVIAQELQKIAPELVQENGEYLSVAYGNLVGYLIEAVKELSAKVEELSNR